MIINPYPLIQPEGWSIDRPFLLSACAVGKVAPAVSLKKGPIAILLGTHLLFVRVYI